MDAYFEKIIQNPTQGKTFSLLGEKGTQDYYADLNLLIIELQNNFHDLKYILNLLRKYSGKKGFLKRTGKKKDYSEISYILEISNKYLYQYTKNADEHIKTLKLIDKFDSTISTIREQYYLYMIEIEIVNRINKNDFIKCKNKMAFLPHCLRDLSRNCMAKPDGLDYLCKGCSKSCFINRVSMELKSENIKPYIWMKANLKTLFKKSIINNENPGVFGMACIVELVRGMRLCMRYNIPVIGIPLNANRCRRWLGKFYDTSVNLEALKRIIGKD